MSLPLLGFIARLGGNTVDSAPSVWASAPCAACRLRSSRGPSVKQPADGSDGTVLSRRSRPVGATGRRDMGCRDKAQRPDISALVAVAEELIATSHELTAHACNTVERSRR